MAGARMIDGGHPSGLLNVGRIVSGRFFRRLTDGPILIEETDSTNDEIWRRADAGASDGMVVFTEHQKVGRGRMGRRWESPRGASVMFSVLLIDADTSPTPAGEHLGLIAGIAATQAVRDATDVRARLVWPNDVFVGDRKLGGVLIESRTLPRGIRAYAIGVGVNCLQQSSHFPDPLRRRATSIDLESHDPVDRERIAGCVLQRLDEWLERSDRWRPERVRDAFLALASPLDRRVTVRHRGEVSTGAIVDVDPSAALVLRLDTGFSRSFPVAGTTVVATVDNGADEQAS